MRLRRHTQQALPQLQAVKVLQASVAICTSRAFFSDEPVMTGTNPAPIDCQQINPEIFSS
jgi:hypothetical protein